MEEPVRVVALGGLRHHFESVIFELVSGGRDRPGLE